MVTLSDDSAVRIWRLARPLVGAPGEGSDMEVGKCERMQREIGTCGFINTFTGVCLHLFTYIAGHGFRSRSGYRYPFKNGYSNDQGSGCGSESEPKSVQWEKVSVQYNVAHGF